ncbi:MAG: ribonuclease III [Lactobacillaceae bacterium]|jgi:ribonuclease-3|nr:ribonuclease III [Lactobacillaceae bacterium]
MNGLIESLKNQFGISFQNIDLLKQAFTHGTYLHDVMHDEGTDYQRLEFLGDSVMQLMVADFLYKSFPEWDEGQLTEARISMVQSKSFSHFARMAHFQDFILLNETTKKQKFNERDNLLEDIFEAFIAALYIDQGEDEVRHFLDQTIYKAFKEGYFNQFINYKTKLQELVQQAGKVDIQYVVTERNEEDQTKPTFTVELMINGFKQASATAPSIKKAETKAAEIAYQELSKQ